MTTIRPHTLRILPALLCIFLLACAGACSRARTDTDSNSPKAEQTTTETAAAQSAGHTGRIHINSVGRLHEAFNDSNHLHYAYARKIGIDPITSLRGAYFTKRPIVRIKDSDYIFIDSLRHSMPFLVPEAARLLADIGSAFSDSLHSRGADGYRLKVTSILRTPSSVKELRRVNRNATDSSTHQFGTTFDISYSKFKHDNPAYDIPQEDLKNLLAEVLADLRRKGRCLVKYERHSACFHITTCN